MSIMYCRSVKSVIAMLLIVATLVGFLAFPVSAVTTSTAARIYSDFTTSPAYKKYTVFANMYVGSKSIPIPGLAHTDVSGKDCTTMVPQGMCFAGDYLIVSAYDSNSSCNSVLYVISNSTRAYLMTVVLPCKSHVGGVAYDGTYLWVSNGKSASSIKYSTLSSTVNNAVAAKKKSVSISFYSTCATTTQASFMTYSDGMLWVGEFKDKGDSSGRMYSYTISSDAKKLTKKYYITLPDRTQGAAFKNGYLMLTRSYSRNISGSTYISEMRIYKYSKVDTSTGNIKKNDAVKVFQLPPMVEAVVAGSTYVYTLYESAATKYYTGSDGSGKCKYPTDRIAAFRFSDMIGGSGSSSGSGSSTTPTTTTTAKPTTTTAKPTTTTAKPTTAPTTTKPTTAPTTAPTEPPTEPTVEPPSIPEVTTLPIIPTEAPEELPTEPDLPTMPDLPEDDGTYLPKCDENIDNFIDALVSKGYDSSKETRKLIAEVNGISSYTGSAQENEMLLSLMKVGLLLNPGLQPLVYEDATLKLDMSAVTMKLGAITQLSAEFEQGDVYWKTSDKNVIKLSRFDDNTISVEAQSTGKATITCTLTNGQYAKCVVNVQIEYFEACDGKAESWVDAVKEYGYATTLEAKNRIASVNGIPNYSGIAAEDDQLLSLLKAGKLINPGLTLFADENTIVRLNKTTVSANVGQKIPLRASFLGGTVIWKSSNLKVATVSVIDTDLVYIDPVGVGKSTITCILSNGKFAKCIVYVSEALDTDGTSSDLYFIKCESSCMTITQGLMSIGVDHSAEYRAKIAIANGIAGYTDTDEQNTYLLSLLKNGKLLKPDVNLEMGQYVVTFDANGGTGTMDRFILAQGDQLPANVFTRKGYTFLGWSTEATGNIVYFNESVVYLTGDTTLYAMWVPHSFILRYDANGGTGTMENTVVTYGIYAAFRTSTFTKTGYTQTGWYLYRSGDNTWQYATTDGASKGWFVEGAEPSGYKKYVASLTSGVSDASTVQDDVVILYAVWESGSSGSSSGSSSGGSSGSSSGSSAGSFDGKKVMFIGNSFVYYGGAVEHGGQKKTDKGWFYQICQANGDDVTVYDCTYGSHHLYDFTTSGCKSGSCHNGKDLLAGVNLKTIDYLFISESGNNNANFIKDVKNVLKRFPSSTKVFYLSHSYTYSKNHTKIINKLSELEKMGISVIEWGKLVDDVIDGRVTVPGATVTYKKNTFIKNKGDTYHPNPLAGYITAQMAYCALTGKSAVGQLPDIYSIGDKMKYGKSAVGYAAYTSKHYKSSTSSNFIKVLKSQSDITGLQKLMNKYLAKRGLGVDG